MTDSFATSTAVTAGADGRLTAEIDSSWAAPNGPNGGYLAAIVARAAEAATPDPDKQLRSLTCHYLRPPQGGPVEIETRVERAGRAVASLSLRMVQDGEPCVAALALLGVKLTSAGDYADEPMPAVKAPAEIEPTPMREGMPAIMAHLETRPALGPRPFSGRAESATGAWIATAEPTPLDAAALCLFCDAWFPAPWIRLEAPSVAPTLDLTIHFRAALPAPQSAPIFVRASSRTSAEGYSEEDAHVWAQDGTLLAQSRQLALLRPVK